MSDPLSPLDVLGRMLPALLVIVGALLLLRRFGQRGPAGAGAGLRVLARTGVTRNAVVAVVQVAERRFLVGAGDAGVRLLAELPPLPPMAPSGGGSDLSGALLPSDAVLDEAQLRPASLSGRPRIGLYRQLQALTVRTRIPRSSDAALR